MRLMPKARRLIAQAVDVLPDPGARAKWHAWSGRTPLTGAGAAPPYDIVKIAMHALEHAAHQLERRLNAAEALDQDGEADILNDLGYVHSVARGLRQMGVER